MEGDILQGVDGIVIGVDILDLEKLHPPYPSPR
jgi:hypothetical protein